ncbi:MAG: hypothetical protein R2704_18860 [Microthrixaceae bacterium]
MTTLQLISARRRTLADQLDDLSADQWAAPRCATPGRCATWLDTS